MFSPASRSTNPLPKESAKGLLKKLFLLALWELGGIFHKIADTLRTDVRKVSVTFTILVFGALGLGFSWLDTKIFPQATTPAAVTPMSLGELPKLPTNEAAPVAANQLTEQMAMHYIARFSSTAKEEMRKYGIPASISLAQGLIESRAGDSKLARSNNNHFGIKCFSRSCKKGHCSNFTDDTHKDFFRKFGSPWESWRAHSRILANGRYAKLKRYGRDYRQWAHGLKAAGYATDRTYAEKLIGIIERYELYQYDN